MFCGPVTSPELSYGGYGVTITRTEGAVARGGWLRRTWEKVAVALAVIGLVDLSRQLFEWAAWIHWVATKYAIVKAWLFDWLPFHIPPEWHDPIVLFLILLSVTNIGVYRETRWRLRSIVEALNTRTALAKFPRVLGILFAVSLAGAMIYILIYLDLFETILRAISIINLGPYVAILSVIAAFFSIVVIFPLSVLVASLILWTAFLVAWRWLLVAAAIFSALVVVNQVYVLWLERLTAH
jgi:hypothetical protein